MHNDDSPLDPLEYLLSVMNDETAPRRDRIAAAGHLLPYFHVSLAPEFAEDVELPAAEPAAPGLQ